ncbi:hypothetical protein [Streptomyces purpurascens]|uniref:hypothetical protein n=1 Tax=Streptomyces purpurascens TaxID=1924 RepID=UPI0016742A1F|nr:hypothetical protein [Streptomyces purpurascens]MCE7049505.1 hypothetical protein [Streptomyces purpurascens]GHA22167.1 hypothetical protein GCM10010303_35840 [Streptomyces purpurascens]
MSDSINVRVTLGSYDVVHPAEKKTQVYVQIPEVARASWLLDSEFFSVLKDEPWPHVVSSAQEAYERRGVVSDSDSAAARKAVVEWLSVDENHDAMDEAWFQDRARRDPVSRSLLQDKERLTARVAELEKSQADADRDKAPWGRGEDGRPLLPMGAHWTDVSELVDRNLAGIHARVDQAQPGSWFVSPAAEAPDTVCTQYDGYTRTVGQFTNVLPADLEFILHAHSDLRWCLEMIAKLRVRVAELDAQREALADRLLAGQTWRRGRTPELVSENFVSQSELRGIFGIPLAPPWSDGITRRMAPTQALRDDEPQPKFFQPSHTYADDEYGWKFRVDSITTHPEDGERTALGWRFWKGVWEPCAYGEDDWEIHQLVDHIAVTEDGDA